jgi:glyoxylase-like metal-dependent hydrolase (beta-lactamase superfamily II)
LIDPDKSIEAGGLVWRVVVGEGHSPQMAALYAEAPGLLISGDQVLPGISPNVSVRDSQPDTNPLKLFLESLLRFKALPADTLVLPSHKLPFYGVRERVDQLIKHHHDRLNGAREACVTGATAGEVMSAMFKRALDPHQMSFALGETLAHLNYLIATGAVVREATLTGADLYQAV